MRDFLACVAGEARFIEQRFPGSEANTAALMEEVGELAQALIENAYNDGRPENVYMEAV